MNKKFDSIFSDTITVTEKIDAHRFGFTKTENGFVYYKKMNATPISIIDRTISDLYEDAIEYIENLDDTIKIGIPLNTRFTFYYMSSSTPLRINYKNIDPILILTDLSIRTESGKAKEIIDDVETIKKWSDKFDCGTSIIFHGKLTSYQQGLMTDLLKFEDGVFEDAININTKFTWLVNEIFGKTSSNNSIISGVYIKTDKDNFKFVNPIFDVIFQESIEPISRDFYDLMLMQLKNFLSDYDIDIIDVSNIVDADLKYIVIISNIFNQFVIQLEPDINPSFLQPNIIGDLGEFNPTIAIQNEETLQLLYKSAFYIEVFKMMLLVMKRPKKSYGLLSIDDVNIINDSIESVKKLIEK